jgi:preprotein translocase subunit SecA
MGLISKFFGTKNDRDIKGMQPTIRAIEALEPKMEGLSDQDLADRIAEMKAEASERIQAMEKAKKGDEPKKADYNKILDEYLVETFAIVREAGKRVLGMRHYDVQMIGGMALHAGRIGEMKTGEGKTLVATLPCVLNALAGKGVHVVTVNDYLASRDAEWMGRLYRFLGLSVGVVVPNMNDREKKAAYRADITYGQNNEFGFDYLRDNMKFKLEDYAQTGHFFAVVDEVDSILIDEARTPLIISGPADQDTNLYNVTNAIVPKLRQGEDYSVDEKARAVMLTEIGVEKVEKLLSVDNLYDPANLELLHHMTKCLTAHTLYKRDVDYVVEGGEVVIVDDHTGRLMHGRRWSDGLHQAVEAKESVRIQAENQTLATVTFQNFFRMYSKLSGMTGTADTEAEEFAKIYDLDVLVIPTNKPIVRDDQNDLIFKTEREKFDAVVEDIQENHAKGTPVLVGTVSVEKSEVLSSRLKKLKIPHKVLNAKRHRDEANIVAQAGRLGAVTIATNMAGRGTDIILGGNPEHMARGEVASKMGQGDEQIAGFGFLTGGADLINVEKLAERDRNDVHYLIQLEHEIEELTAKAAEAKEKGEEYEPPPDAPKNLEEAKERVYAQRLEYYQNCVTYYTEAVERLEKVCKEEKAKVLEAGGLRIIGTERHDSRRIDNQLRGRAGRQGDPGSSGFYLCLQDDLMRIFGSDKMIGMMERLGMEDGMPIEHGLVTKSIANAQKRVEGMHFDSRKNVLEYDDVMNQQRKAIYGRRRSVLEGTHIRELVYDLVEEAVVSMVSIAAPEKVQPVEWKLEALQEEIMNLFGVHVDLVGFDGDRDDLMDKTFKECERFYNAKVEEVGEDMLKQLEVYLYLQTIDQRWKEHLQAMDHLREGIGLRGYGQKNPVQEYKKEGYNLFMNLMATIRDEVLEKVFKAQIQKGEDEGSAELDRLRQKRAADAEKQRKRQVSTHGNRNGTASRAPGRGGAPATSASPMPRFGSQGGDGGEENLNRAQRRRLKAKKRKGQKGRRAQ